MFCEVWVITWHKNGGKLHQLHYNTEEEAERWADRLMDRTERDGIRREWVINCYYRKV